MTLSGVPGRLFGKLFTKFKLGDVEFKVKEVKKMLEQKFKMIIIQLIVMGAAVKDDAAIVY